MDLLHRTTIHFVHCILPQHNAGLCDLKTSLMQSSADGKTSSRDDIMLNVPLVRAQIRGAQLVDAVRLHRQGVQRVTELLLTSVVNHSVKKLVKVLRPEYHWCVQVKCVLC